MTIDEQTARNLRRIFEIVEARRDTFGKVLVGFALSKEANGEVKVCSGLLKFLRKGEAPLKEETYDYGNLILKKRLMEVQEVLPLLRSVFEDETLKLEALPNIPLRARIPEVRSLESRMRYWYILSEWPMLYAYASIDDATHGKIPQGPFVKSGLPLFPGGAQAVSFFFDLPIPIDIYSLDYRLDLIIPDYRARISSLHLSGNRVSVRVETGELSQDEVLAKFYCRGKSKAFMSDDLHLRSGQADFVADEEPLQVEAHIISTVESGSIDARRYDYRYPATQEGIVIENVEAQLLDMIAKGENVNVEFKRELNEKKDKKEFVETVVAFANTSGGTVFLGVDDHCKIIGFSEDKAKIEDLIADSCDPSIDFQIEPVIIKGLPITLVKVREGTNKPYMLRGNGIFLRRGSSDRQANRGELDEIYAKRSQTPYR